MFLLLFLRVTVPPVRTEGGEIIGGTTAPDHSKPYMTLIKYYNEGQNPYRCGGLMVKEDTIMTAAHCNGSLFSSYITVTLGVHDIYEQNNPNPFRVLKAISHEKYYKERKVNDIMLLKLEKKAQVSYDVDTINLTKSNDPVKLGKNCSVAGWGNLADCHLSNTLQKVYLQVQEGKICQWMSKNYNDTIQLCMGNPKEMKATAGGDTGGPLVCDNVAHGIVSYHSCITTPP